MTVFFLKLLAALSMSLDHLGILLYANRVIGREPYLLLRVLGRPALPLYCFLLAEGFRHLEGDRARLRRQGLMLLALALVSEPFFDCFLYGSFFSSKGQSVMLTLLLGYCAMWAGTGPRGPWLTLPAFALAGGLAWLLHTDYGAAGILLLALFWAYCRWAPERPWPQRLLGALGCMLFYYAFYAWIHTEGGDFPELLAFVKANWARFLAHLALAPLLAAYRGELGPRFKALHRAYQCYYPAHLALLCLAGALI